MKSAPKTLSTAFFMLIFVCGYSQESNFNMSGYLDFYYAYDFYDPPAKQRQYITQAARHNEFNLNLGFVQAAYASDNIRGNLAIQVGTYPTANYGGEPNAFAQLIQNASAGLKIGEKTWVDAGIMGGHFGYEGLISMDNELYTQALATEYTPYYQTGVQLSSELSEKLSFRAVVINGWQNIYETNNGKSFGIGLDYMINDRWGISYGNYIGKDPVNGEDRLRFHNNFYLTYTGEKFSSAFVVDYMFEDLSNSQELALNQSSNLYFITFINQFQINDSWKVAGRYEYVEDPANALFSSPTGVFQSNIVTLALRRSISEQVVFSMEFRQFFGKEDIWRSRENETGTSNTILSTGLTMRFF
ncbi:MAG: outer membrane beta-barrel protein [Cyclobacteriaceae bacterium]